MPWANVLAPMARPSTRSSLITLIRKIPICCPDILISFNCSENRFLDIFDESLCDGNDRKSECYTLFDDNEAFFSDWFFQQGHDQFLQKFCFSHVPGCSQERLDEADRREAEERTKREAEEKAKKELEAAQETEKVDLKMQEELPKDDVVKPIAEETVKSETPPPTFLDRLQDIPFYTRMLVVGILALMFYTITTYISVASDTRAYRKVQ